MQLLAAGASGAWTLLEACQALGPPCHISRTCKLCSSLCHTMAFWRTVATMLAAAWLAGDNTHTWTREVCCPMHGTCRAMQHAKHTKGCPQKACSLPVMAWGVMASWPLYFLVLAFLYRASLQSCFLARFAWCMHACMHVWLFSLLAA